MHSAAYRSTISAKTLGRLALLGLAILAVASCQTDPEKPQGRQTYTADLPAIPDTLMPQRGVIKAQSDTATATFTVLPANIKIDLDAPPAETVKVDLWRAGVKMYELDYVHSGSQKLVYTRSKRENTLGVTLLRRIYPSSDSLAFVAEFAKLLVENDPLVLSLGFPAKSIEGVDTALVMRKAMEIVAAKQLPVSSVIPKDGPWALGLDSAAVHARIQELVREGKIEVDTAKLFPPYPMRTKNGIALDAQLVAGGPAVGVTGAFEATYKVVNLSSRVLRDGQESKDFEIPTLAFSEYPKLLDLSGKLSIRAKESAAAGSYTLEITAQDDSLRKAVSSVDFQVVPAADKQGPQIEITSPAANTVLENAVDKIDVKAVVSDPSGVDSVWIDNRAASLIDGKWTVEGVSIPVTNLGHKVVVRATDSNGNGSTADIVVGRMSPLDPGAPITSVVQPKETEFPFDSASVLVRWKIEDPRAEVTKVWIGGQEATKEDGFVWAGRVSLPPTGTPTTITFLGVNAKNDSTQKFVQLTRKTGAGPDTSKPVIVRQAGTETKNVGFDVGEVSVGWKVTDNAAVTVKIDGSRVEPNASGVYGATIVLVKASTGVKIEATDAAGNARTDSITISKASDAIDPVVVRQVGTKDTTVPYATASYMVAWKVTDNGGVKTVEIGGKTPSKDGDIYSFQVALTKPGKYVVKIVALDNAGNDFADSVTIVRAYHDSIAPVVTPADTATRTKTVPYATAKATLSWKVTDNDAIYSVTIGGSVVPGAAGVYSRTVDLVVGPNTVLVVAKDTADNSDSESVVITREPEPAKLSWVGGTDILGAEDSVVKTSMRLLGIKGSTVRIRLASSAKAVLADTLFTVAAAGVDLEVPLHFAPKPNANGKVGVTLSAVCAAESTAIQFQFVAASRNDAPSFTLSKSSVDLNGTAVQTLSKWADEMSTGPSDESGQKLRFQVEQLDATELLVTLPAIDSVGTLKVQAKPGISGVARFQVRLLDNGDSLVGNKNSSGWVAFQVAVNAPPTLTLPVRTYSFWQNSVQSPGSVVLADDETSVGNLVLSKSSSNAQVLPADSVYISGTGASRKLTFRPVRDQAGLATVYLTVKDSMGGVFTDSMLVQVNAMNRAPSFTLSSASVVLQNYNRDSLLLKCVSAESANDPQQQIKERRVDLIGAPQDTVLTAKATLDAEGTLHLPRRPNLRGWFTFRITIKDNGGIDIGGVDSVSKDLKIFFADTIIDPDDRNIYRYVVLGKRAWLAENLRKTPRWGASTVAMKDSLGGYLYDWAQAFDLDSVACYGKNCADQVVPVTQGLCPVGWNIPDSLEWRLMVNWAAQGGTDSQAVVRLKSKTGWGPQTYGLGAIFLDPGLDQWGFGITDNYGYYSSPGWRAGLYWARRWQSTGDLSTLDQLAAGFSSSVVNGAPGTYSESFDVYGIQWARYTPIHPVRCIKSLPPGQWQ